MKPSDIRSVTFLRSATDVIAQCETRERMRKRERERQKRGDENVDATFRVRTVRSTTKTVIFFSKKVEFFILKISVRS